MIDVTTDLHVHSKYSRAVSPQMNLFSMAQVGIQKGIDLLATSDWTHPLWIQEIQNQLEESQEGLFVLKNNISNQAYPHPRPLSEGEEDNRLRFLLSTEVSTIFSQNGKGRRIHQLIFVPNFSTAEKINKQLLKRGCNLVSDGRPILGLSSKNLLELIMEIDNRSLIIPAHIWTPWFGIYGQMSGFDSLDEAYGDMAPYIYGIETGLSSDPEMNWQIEELDSRSILSFSDAHSLAKMGREATVFRLESLSYENIRQAIMRPSKKPVIASEVKRSSSREIATSTFAHPKSASFEEAVSRNDDMNKVLYTIEFYPEEGKYHYSGHRKCGVVMTPALQQADRSICPVCGKKVTDGVERRVQELGKKSLKAIKKQDNHSIVWITDPSNTHPPFAKIVPLNEIIAEAIGSPVSSPKVKVIFDSLCQKIPEFELLLQSSIKDIEKVTLLVTSAVNVKKIGEGIERVRNELLSINPGYDGVYGTVAIWNKKNNNQTKSKQKINQIPLDI